MFGKQQNGNDGAAQRPELPPLRHFRVTRYIPDGSGVGTLDVFAHGIQWESGCLMFSIGVVIEPEPGQFGVISQMIRGFKEWIDYEEIIEQPSMLVH